jgi:hypothetical protein
MKIKIFDKIDVSKLISARDGYQEYYGIEIGQEPSDKTFKVYRSADEIRKLSDKLVGIPVINGHDSDKNWDNQEPIDQSIIVSKIISSEVKESETKYQDSTIEIYNVIENNEIVEQLRKEKNELSVGYSSDLEQSSDPQYDFVQINIEPRHLAIEETGRCGGGCKFIDRGVKVEGLEELLAALGLDEEKTNLLKEFLSKRQTQDSDDDDDDGKKTEDSDDEDEKEKKELQDKVTKLETLLKDKEKSFKDSVIKIGNERAEAIEKIKKLDPEYKFEDKTNCEIKRAVVEKQFPNKKFEDAEISALFKVCDVLPALNIEIKSTNGAVAYYTKKEK